MRRFNKQLIPIVVIILVFAVSILMFIFSGHRKDIGAIKAFNADVKIFRLNTEIQVSDDATGEQLFTIKGNILRFLTDPLTLYGTDGEERAFGDDEYHIVAQDTHWITSIYGEEVKMVGEFNILGDSYQIYVNDRQVAYAKFNAFNTYGELWDMDGNLMADYSSRYAFKDYVVQATEYNTFSDETLNMIFASYYSDQEADSNSSNHSSND